MFSHFSEKKDPLSDSRFRHTLFQKKIPSMPPTTKQCEEQPRTRTPTRILKDDDDGGRCREEKENSNSITNKSVLSFLLTLAQDPTSGVLHEAIRYNNMEMATILLKSSSADDCVQPSTTTKDTQHEKVAQPSLEHSGTRGRRRRVDPSGVNHKGLTPADYAVLHNRPEMLELLAAYGALDAPNMEGETSLFTAIRLGSFKMVKILLDLGSDPNWIAEAPNTTATATGQNVHHKSTPNSTTKQPKTPLLVACSMRSNENTEDIVKLLVQRGADASGKSCSVNETVHSSTLGDTPLSTAVLSGASVNTVLTLIHYGAQCNTRHEVAHPPCRNPFSGPGPGYQRMTLFQLAVWHAMGLSRNGSHLQFHTAVNVVRAIAKEGVVVREEVSSLFMTIQENSWELFLTLLELGVDVNQRLSQDGEETTLVETPLMHLLRSHNIEKSRGAQLMLNTLLLLCGAEVHVWVQRRSNDDLGWCPIITKRHRNPFEPSCGPVATIPWPIKVDLLTAPRQYGFVL